MGRTKRMTFSPNEKWALPIKTWQGRRLFFPPPASYPSLGCTPAEPNSVSLASRHLTHEYNFVPYLMRFFLSSPCLKNPHRICLMCDRCKAFASNELPTRTRPVDPQILRRSQKRALPRNLWASFVIPGMQRLGFPRHGEDQKNDI